ncbi:hypothetical protein Avbf_09350 [Armadillidium vulgare]|nr:hypothetical protein Avbf_09350 [Armadillidium vulgare]
MLNANLAHKNACKKFDDKKYFEFAIRKSICVTICNIYSLCTVLNKYGDTTTFINIVLISTFLSLLYFPAYLRAEL